MEEEKLYLADDEILLADGRDVIPSEELILEEGLTEENFPDKLELEIPLPDGTTRDYEVVCIFENEKGTATYLAMVPSDVEETDEVTIVPFEEDEDDGVILRDFYSEEEYEEACQIFTERSDSYHQTEEDLSAEGIEVKDLTAEEFQKEITEKEQDQIRDIISFIKRF